MTAEDPQPVGEAARLRQAMTDLSGDIGDIREYAQRTRHFTRWLTVSILFDVLLSCALGFIAVETRTATCRAGNEFKRADKARWEYIVSLTPVPTDPHDKAIRDKFVAYINAADELRTCSIL